jgi:hypothetical protein
MRITSAGELQLTGNGVLRNQESGGNFSYLQQTSSDARLFVQYSQPLLFGTNNTESMRIDSSGRLLLGHTASVANFGLNNKVQVQGTSAETAGVSIVRNSNDANPSYLLLGKTRSTSEGGFGLVTNGDNVGNITFTAADGVDQTSIVAQILASVDGVASADDTPGRLTFLTTPDGSQTPTERMRIDSSGNVGIGTISPNSYTNYTTLTINGTSGGLLDFETNGTLVGEAFADSTNGVALQSIGSRYIRFLTNGGERVRIDSSGNLLVGCTDVPSASVGGAGFDLNTNARAVLKLATTSTGNQGLAEFFNPNGQVGGIVTNGSATAYNTSSDQRLKENIVDAPSASDDIDAIQVRSFDWKADGSHQKYGMVAQELQSVAPEAVSGDADSDDMMGVDYSKLVPMMMKEIQSLRARVAQLEGAN